MDGLFRQFKGSVQDIDPVTFTANRIMLHGKKFNIVDCGRKYLHEIYRTIGIEATRKDGKPVVILKSRQVEATTMATNLDMYFAASGNFKYLNILHTFPQIGQAQRFSKARIDPILTESSGGFLSSKIDPKDTPTLTYKKFKDNNVLYLEALSNDANRLRNMQFDIIFFDEIQDTSKDALDAVTPALLRSKVGPLGKGVQVYFGTPKNKGSYFEQLWRNSDQRYFYLGCENCFGYFLLYTPGSQEWENIWVTGHTVKCPTCGHHQHKVGALERGRWFPTPGRENAPYIGFHYNQFFVPEMTKEAILDNRPSESGLVSPKKWMNEILGEFYAGAGAPITFDEILSLCADRDRGMPAYIDRSERKMTFMGVDWGSASHESGKSKTSVVIVSIDSQNRIIIEFAKIYDKADWKNLKPQIMDLWRRYNVIQAVVDCGSGQVQVSELHDLYKDRVLGCWSSFNIKKPYKFDRDNLTIAVCKDVVIEDMIHLMRNGRIRFPYKHPELTEWLLVHCSSMDIETRTHQGIPRQVYVKGSDPNDGMMALMYAMLAYRFKETNGFQIKKDVYNKDKKSNLPGAQLAYVPGRI